MVERLFEGVALRKARLEKERQDKLDKINAPSNNTLPVPTAYQQGEPRIAWICPVPYEKVTETKTITTRVVSIDWDSFNTYDVPKILKDKEITRTITHTSYKRDWSNFETTNEEVSKIWAGFDKILTGKKDWPEEGKLLSFNESNQIVCPQCGKRGVSKKLLQTRSADEAPTEILTCIHCGFTLRAKD